MAHPWINRDFYEATVRFEESDAAQELFYRVMDTKIERGGKTDTVRNQILNRPALRRSRRQLTGFTSASLRLTPITGTV